MTHSLQHEFDELNDILDDFEAAGFPGAESLFGRFVAAIEKPPLASLMDSLTPSVDFPTWYDASMATTGGMVGSGYLNWPHDRAERVGMMREMFRAIGRGKPALLEVAHTFTYVSGGHYTDMLDSFSQKIARPFLRDLIHLVNLRAEAPVLSEALAKSFPSSGDAILDELLIAARDGFRDLSPATRRIALEKLWDAWERLKTLESQEKSTSTNVMLDRATTEPRFRAVLEEDARSLTDIGNSFHIRHFETSRSEVTASSQIDYLFHRLWALVWLLVSTSRTTQK